MQQKDSIEVFENISVPNLILAKADTLTCVKKIVNLSASIQNRTNYSLLWTTSQGNIISPPQNKNITVNQQGFYSLKLTNNANGCEVEQKIEVVEDKVPPMINILGLTQLNCRDSVLTLSVTPNLATYSYVWNAALGNSKNDINISQSGTYAISVTNNKNGCITQKSIAISEDKIKPLLIVPTPAILTCVTTKTLISAQSNLNTARYEWLFPDGKK